MNQIKTSEAKVSELAGATFLPRALPRWADRAFFAGLGAVLTLLVSHFPTYYELYQKWFHEPLHIAMAGVVTERVFFKIDGDAANPVDTRMYVNLTNGGELPIEIASYSVVARVGQQWEQLNPTPALEEGSIIAFVRNDSLSRLNLEKEGFDFKTRNGLPPGSQVSGWIFLRSNPSAPPTQYRFTFIDASNKRHIIDIDAPTEQQGFAALNASGLVPMGPLEQIPANLKQYAVAH